MLLRDDSADNDDNYAMLDSFLVANPSDSDELKNVKRDVQRDVHMATVSGACK